MNTYTLKRIEELSAVGGGAMKLAAADLGVRSFGLRVLDLPPGYADYPEHDHTHDGQEEVYVILDGSADFEVAGEHAHADAGAMLRVPPEARRKLVPGPSGARILAIGSVMERP